MSRTLDDLDVWKRTLTRVGSGGCYRSLAHVAKAISLSDDRVSRSLARAVELLGGLAVVEVRNNRLALTPEGSEFLTVVDRLLAIGQSARTVETLRVATAPGVPPGLVADAAAAFVQAWSGLVTLRISPSADVSELVDSGQADVGITAGVSGGDRSEELPPARPLLALIPASHRLHGLEGVFDADHFSDSDDRVFLPSDLREPLAELLSRVPDANRVVVDEPGVLHALVCAGAGIGFCFAPPRQAGECFTRIVLPQITPRPLGLILPKKKSLRTEPLESFVAALRDAAVAAAEPDVDRTAQAERVAA